jgi:hypothetical protein
MQTMASREALYSYFDDYTAQRRGELNQRSLQRGMGLLKTYLIEARSTADSHLPEAMAATGWSLLPVDDGLYGVTGIAADVDGYLDVISDRYFALYTTAPSRLSDRAIRRAVRASVDLDHVWFSSPILDMIWRDLSFFSHLPVTVRYESESLFEQLYHEVDGEELDDDESDNEGDGRAPKTRDDHAPFVARLEINNRLSVLHRLLSRETALGELMGNLSRVKTPSRSGVGRYEYFHYGKLTNRGEDFRSFAAHSYFLAEKFYRHLTEMIEHEIWVSLEYQTSNNSSKYEMIQGAPITVVFPTPLPLPIFERFVEATFDRGQGPFRLWGNPIRMDGPKVHVYGLDLHLWQQIYLDLTPTRFVIVLPRGTCGNTVHRLMTNIQRYLSPGAEVFVGSTSYKALVRKALGTT